MDPLELSPGSRELAPGERHQLVHEWNDTRVGPLPEDTVLDRIEAWVEQRPDAVAVACEGQGLTWRELDRRAERLARRLRELGVRPEMRVGICTERSLDMIVGLVGIWKAGGAYVPLDPDHPAERRALILEDAGAPVLVTHRGLARDLSIPGVERVELEELPTVAEPAPGPPPERPGPDHLAYVLFTSGSTGRPKGVQIAHRGLTHRVDALAPPLDLREGETWPLFHSYTFDFSAWEKWACLALGGRLAVVPLAVARDPVAFHDLMVAERMEVLNQTPSGFRQLAQVWERRLRDPGELALRVIVIAGEALPAEYVRPVFGIRPELWNLYGPTETTVYATLHPIGEADLTGGLVPVGRALADSRLRILDAHLRLVPAGVPGELCFAAERDVGLARCYHGRPDLTADRFVPDPMADTPGARLYRSGDLAAWRKDGVLEYLGRIDHQIKIRGFRVDPGEIEAALLAHPGVQQAVVMLRRDPPEDRLVAYVVGSTGEPPPAEELRSELRRRLPEYMVPAVFVPLPSLPLTPHGKVDRAALPVPEAALPEVPAADAPRTPVEEALTQIVADLLGRARVGTCDSFFDLGGHSLLATQLALRVNDAFGVELPVTQVFDSPTCAALAQRVEEQWAAGRPLAARPIEPADRSREIPLAFAQERLWFLDRLEPGNPLYSVPLRITLKGEIAAGLFEPILGALVRRHEALRTTFSEGRDGPVQVIAPEIPWSLPLVDLAGLPDPQVEALRQEWEESLRPFDLERGPVIRGALLRLGERNHLLLLNIHHITLDGGSIIAMGRELRHLYSALTEGRQPSLPPLPIQYADFAVWQRRWMSGEALEEELRHWRERLAGAPGAMALSTDRPRPPVQTFRGAFEPLPDGGILDPGLEARLNALARSRGATLYMVLLAAFQVLLRRYTGQEDLIVGSPIANRTRKEVEGLIGFFANTLALRTDASGDPTFAELLERVRETALFAYAHQDLPFERLVQALAPSRDLSHSPIFQVFFGVHNYPFCEPELVPGVELDIEEIFYDTAKFDLTLGFQRVKAGLGGGVEYNTDLFDRVTAKRLLAHLGRVLEEALAYPGERISSLSLLSEPERHQALVEWNDSAAELDRGSCIHEFFQVWVERRPHETAVLFGDDGLTYGELDRRANRLAHRLRELGVGPEVRVGLCLERSLDAILSILGILKAGGAYVPLDPAYPQERLAFMVEDARMPVVVTRAGLAGVLPLNGKAVVRLDEDAAALALYDEGNPASGVEPGNLAYVIYTSGSTGRPKGVMVEHRQAANLAADPQIESFRLSPECRVLQFASLSFDSSVADLLIAFRAGAVLCLAPQEDLMPGAPLLSLLRRQEITNVTLPPSVLATLETAELPRLGTILAGGEACPAELVSRWAPGRRFYNTYGPSETTVCATATLCNAGTGTPSLGRPITNTAVYLLDRTLEPVPAGVPGELFIGGNGVARGYLDRPDLTAERFVPDPFGGAPGARLYRTGDLGRQRRNGEVEFLGRVDFQVKLRGFRIELEEVESTLLRHPAVRQAAVLVREDTPGDRRLVGYLVPGPGADPNVGEVRSFLKESLPEHMVPSALMILPALPLLPNGKLDRRALPAPERGRIAADHVPPRTPMEQALADIWSDLLGLERVGALDDFFDLGGHSLLATQMVSRVRDHFAVEVPVRHVFERSRMADLAQVIEELLVAQIASLTEEEAAHLLGA